MHRHPQHSANSGRVDGRTNAESQLRLRSPFRPDHHYRNIDRRVLDANSGVRQIPFADVAGVTAPAADTWSHAILPADRSQCGRQVVEDEMVRRSAASVFGLEGQHRYSTTIDQPLHHAIMQPMPHYIQMVPSGHLPLPIKLEDRRNSSQISQVANTHAEHADESDDDHVGHTVSGRKARSHVWPPLSDGPDRIRRPAQFESRTIGHTGRNSGRNLLAILQGSDNTPRTRHNLRILRGRGPGYLPNVRNYPACDVEIPGGLTLEEICQSYPRHVWGTCLRLFIAEGWTGERIYNALPDDFRDSKALQRPWNYIQQGFTREVRRMNEEAGLVTVRGQKRRLSTVSDDRGSRGHHDYQRRHPMSLNPELNVLPQAQRSFPDTQETAESNLSVKNGYNRQKRIKLSPTVYDEVCKQEHLLLFIMYEMYPQYRLESPDKQRDRVRRCHVWLQHKYDVLVESSSLSRLQQFTHGLEQTLSGFSTRQPVLQAGYTHVQPSVEVDNVE